MSKIKTYHDNCPFKTDEDFRWEWEIECVKQLGEGCICWRCEEDHDDTTQWIDDWKGREYFEEEMSNGNK